MRAVFGQSSGPLILLHGGAGPMDPSKAGIALATESLRRIASSGMDELSRGRPAIDVVVTLLRALELDEQFNAGRGSALQADGQARLTAALMDSERNTFSGVIGARYLVHPSILARALQSRKARVLAEPGTELLARELNIPVETAVTPKRLQRWADLIEGGRTFLDDASDTVGVLVRNTDGQLAVGTSTGGRGCEVPGRVSDSATVAGTYCSRFAAVSATGVGEEIVDDALAARVETRRRDGMALEAACRRCLDEATVNNRNYGWIAVDHAGYWAVCHTTPAMSWTVFSQTGQIACAIS